MFRAVPLFLLLFAFAVPQAARAIPEPGWRHRHYHEPWVRSPDGRYFYCEYRYLADADDAEYALQYCVWFPPRNFPKLPPGVYFYNASVKQYWGVYRFTEGKDTFALLKERRAGLTGLTEADLRPFGPLPNMPGEGEMGEYGRPSLLPPPDLPGE